MNEEIKNKVILNIEELPDNFGQVKGGKKAYIINFDKSAFWPIIKTSQGFTLVKP